MDYFKSDFLFIYNIPSYIDDRRLGANIPHLLYIKSTPNPDADTKYGFALVSMEMDNFTEEAAAHRSMNIQRCFKDMCFNGVNLDVDTVWFKSTSESREPPPHSTMVRSNFLFVYNIPQFGVDPAALQRMTNCPNVVMLVGNDGVSKCAFVELSAVSSDDEYYQLVEHLRTKPIPGYSGENLEADEVWFKPFSTDLMIRPTIPPESEIAPVVPMVPVQTFQSAPPPVQTFQSAPPPVQTFQSAPPPVQTFQSAPPPVQTFQSAPPPVQTFQSAPPPIRKPLMGASPGPSQFNQLNVSSYPSSSMMSNGNPAYGGASANPPPKSDLTAKLDAMGDDQIEVLMTTLKNNLQQLQQLAVNGGVDVNQLTSKINEITQYYERRKQQNNISQVLDLLKPNQATSTPSSFASEPPMMKRPLMSQPPGGAWCAPLPLAEGEPMAKRTPDLPPPIAAPIEDDKQSLCKSCFLFVSNIPVKVDLTALIRDIPQVTNLVILDRTDPQHMAGFAMLRSFEPVDRAAAATALHRKLSTLTRGLSMQPAQFDRVWLEPVPDGPQQSVREQVAPSQPPTRRRQGFDDEPGYKPLLGAAPGPQDQPPQRRRQGFEEMNSPPMQPPSAQRMGANFASTSHGPTSEPRRRQGFAPGEETKPLLSVFAGSAGGLGNSFSNAMGLKDEEVEFMKCTGNSIPTAPVFYCVEVSKLGESTTSTSFYRMLQDIFHRTIEFILFHTEKKTRRALVFGGSLTDADIMRSRMEKALKSKIKDFDLLVTACNLPSTLAPINSDIARRLFCRRLVVTGLPNWPAKLILARIGFFASKVVMCLLPEDIKGLVLGHVYLGYANPEDCQNDFIRLSDWRFTDKHLLTVKFAVETGWGPDGPIGITPSFEYDISGISTSEILVRRGNALTDRDKAPMDLPNLMTKYHPKQPIANDLNRVIGRNIYNAGDADLQALVVHGLRVSATIGQISKFVEKNIKNAKAYSVQLDWTGKSKQMDVFFGTTKTGVTKGIDYIQKASNELRDIYKTQDKEFDQLFFYEEKDPVRFLVVRHKQDTFIPVSSEFAMARGCQFLLVYDLPTGEGWTKATYLEILCSLFQSARSFWVPVGRKDNAEIVVGAAYARFDDPRKCREAYNATAPKCRYGDGKAARVTYAAMHKTVNSVFASRKMPAALHNFLSWTRFDKQKEPFPWVPDNGSTDSFFCTCHFDGLPFKA